jgi:hypothetical protein
MPNSVYAAVPLMALLAVGQTAVFARLPILGAVPLIPFLVALLWGLLRGIEEGAIWAFAPGFSSICFPSARWDCCPCR